MLEQNTGTKHWVVFSIIEFFVHSVWIIYFFNQVFDKCWASLLLPCRHEQRCIGMCVILSCKSSWIDNSPRKGQDQQGGMCACSQKPRTFTYGCF